MVLSVRIAEMGLSMSCLYFLSKAAPGRPSRSSIDTNDMGEESKTASSTEQVNETPNAVKRNTSNSPMDCGISYTNTLSHQLDSVCGFLSAFSGRPTNIAGCSVML